MSSGHDPRIPVTEVTANDDRPLLIERMNQLEEYRRSAESERDKYVAQLLAVPYALRSWAELWRSLSWPIRKFWHNVFKKQRSSVYPAIELMSYREYCKWREEYVRLNRRQHN